MTNFCKSNNSFEADFSYKNLLNVSYCDFQAETIVVMILAWSEGL